LLSSTSARLDGNEWVINGTKRWPSEAGVAEVYLIVCTTDPEHQSDEGIALIYVPAATPGLSFGKPENKMGMRYTDVNADIYLDEVRVPKEYRAAGPGEDCRLLRHVLSWGRLVSAPNAVGNAQAVFEIVVDYTGNRFYGGKQVREHSMQASIIADMAIAIESARAYYLMVSSMFDNRKIYGDHASDSMIAKASAAKVYAADVTVKVCNMAMELMGSYGYSKDFHVEKYLRDSKIIQLWAGGSHAARLDVARGYYPIN
jgi:alkylation response protein AidB-like acyl-CoA dehydrogenase